MSCLGEYILEMKNIGKTFSGVNVLRNVNLQLKEGEVLALMGENGAGKSTLIKVLSGYHQPDPGGEVIVEGKSVVFHNPKDAMNAHIHTIYQELTLCKDMTVAENIVMDKVEEFGKGLINQRKFEAFAKEILDKLQVNISPSTYIRDLTIAQQQMVEIAKAISSNSKILILDEPTASISERDSERLLEIVRGLRDEGLAIIYITHRMHEVYEVADRICVLRDGDLIDIVKASETNNDQLISMMIGRQLTNAYPKVECEIGDVVFRAENLTTDAYQDVSFEVRKGEIFGIGGLVGSKRTEILETIFGLRKIKSGKMELFGQPYTPKGPADAIGKGIAFATEDRKKSGLVLVLPIHENINMVNAKEICAKKAGFLDLKKCRALAQKYRERLDIKLSNLNEPVSTLSGGNMQKVVLAKWMEMNPKVVLFDEPTRGIDIGAKAEIYKFMGELVSQGAAVLMVSSEMPELLSVADRIMVMSEGHMTGELRHEEASQEAIMSLASVHF